MTLSRLIPAFAACLVALLVGWRWYEWRHPCVRPVDCRDIITTGEVNIPHAKHETVCGCAERKP